MVNARAAEPPLQAVDIIGHSPEYYNWMVLEKSMLTLLIVSRTTKLRGGLQDMSLPEDSSPALKSQCWAPSE